MSMCRLQNYYNALKVEAEAMVYQRGLTARPRQETSADAGGLFQEFRHLKIQLGNWSQDSNQASDSELNWATGAARATSQGEALWKTSRQRAGWGWDRWALGWSHTGPDQQMAGQMKSKRNKRALEWSGAICLLLPWDTTRSSEDRLLGTRLEFLFIESRCLVCSISFWAWCSW